MTTIRIRPPDDFDPPRYTVEWYGAMGDGVWVVLENGRISRITPASAHG